MALKTLIPFPIFAPIFTTITTTVTPATTSSPPTEIRFSRWNNANADKFENPRRSQQQIEDDLRRLRRFNSALNITTLPPSTTATTTTNPSFKSTGTPSQPSRPSIPGKKSKYSKPYKDSTHPAFRTGPKRPKFPRNTEPDPGSGPGPGTDIRVGENGLTYVVPGAPFEYMYSYTETPKNVRPVGLREPAVTPFGPGTMPRPWTGRRPLPESKKKVPEFDSFNVPESGKRGVKHVQRPGPFLPGTGPRYVMSREEVLGEELTVEEVKDLVDGCRKTKRQLNMGRDGLTHNMLDNIHAHWKRRRVCKIKCLGVCTVDMDNVCQQLEDKTGGKIIYRRGGVVYVFRGRNYNYRTRPLFPLMLWRPVTPIYPRLVKRVPEGLTLEEATDMRKRGRDLIPICKLGKNGVYANLAKNVREAFEECELVRINCQGLNPSDYRKIGAKLKDLVPCVLISFENEHILMWRGRDWKPSLPLAKDGAKGDSSSKSNSATSNGSVVDLGFVDDDDEEDESLLAANISNQGISDESPKLSEGLADDTEVVGVMKAEDGSSVKDDYLLDSLGSNSNSAVGSMEKETRIVNKLSHDVEPTLSTVSVSELAADISDQSEVSLANCPTDSAADGESRSLSETSSPCTPSVVDLLRLAVESGRAVILDGSSLDADMVYERSVAFAQIAPPGPVYRHQPQKVVVKTFVKQKSDDLKAGCGEVKEAAVSDPVNKSKEKKPKDRKSTRIQKEKDFTQEFLDVVPQGSLEIDELAKLLA